MTARTGDPDYAAELTVHPLPGGCTIEQVDNEDNFQVQNGDEIHMVRPLEKEESVTLLIALGEEYGTTIAGLSFGRNSEAAYEADRELDTKGEYYGDTPYKLSPGPLGSVLVEVVNADGRYAEEPWFFDIWPKETRTGRIDPKIYNKGAGDDPPGRS